jgi:hypothetical protein
MLLAASVATTRMDRLVERWDAERQLRGPLERRDGALLEGEVVLRGVKDGYRPLSEGEIGSPFDYDHGDTGLFVVFEWRSWEVVWQHGWGSTLMFPFGFCFADGVLYLVDSWGAAVFAVDVLERPGRLLARITHPHLNDVHSVRRTERGLLVTSSGTDAVLELDLDGRLLYEWWAADHGYTDTPSGAARRSERGAEHRDKLYHSRYQTTHVNDALFADADEQELLALLMLPGQIVRIDRSKPAAEQRPEVLIGGLANPHGLRRTPYGWMVTNTSANRVLLLDEGFHVVDSIHYGSRWIHDALMLSTGEVVLNDPHRGILVQFSGPPWRLSRVVPYPKHWRLFRLEEVPDRYAERFARRALNSGGSGLLKCARPRSQ